MGLKNDNLLIVKCGGKGMTFYDVTTYFPFQSDVVLWFTGRMIQYV